MPVLRGEKQKLKLFGTVMGCCKDDFADNADVFAEIACRKLNYLGIIEKDGAWWSCKEEDE